MASVLSSTASRPLGLLENLGLSEARESQLRLVDGYDMSPVARRIRRKNLLDDSIVEPAIAEFKRFMALFILGHRGIDMRSKEVDEVWHTFILFTMEYTAFCEKVAGRYIHHRPSESMIKSERQSQSYLPIYERYFGATMHWEIQRGLLEAEASSGCKGCDDCGVS